MLPGNEIQYKVLGRDIIEHLRQRADKAEKIGKALEVDGEPPTSQCDRGIWQMVENEVRYSRLRAKYLDPTEVYLLSSSTLIDIFIEQDHAVGNIGMGMAAPVDQAPTSEARW